MVELTALLIGGLRIRLSPKLSRMLAYPHFANFIDDNDDICDIDVDVVDAGFWYSPLKISSLSGEIVHVSPSLDVISTRQGTFWRLYSFGKSEHVDLESESLCLWINVKASRIVILCDKHAITEHQWALLCSGFENIIRFCITRFSGIVMHASAVKTRDGVILFTGVSGAGKSSQARLWEKYKNVMILNHDRPIIRLTASGINVYGSPWSGSDNCYVNEKEKLKCIVLLEQDRENAVRKLSDSEIVMSIFPRFSIPIWDIEGSCLALNTIKSIVQDVPCLLLKCNLTKTAVDELDQWLQISS